MQLIFCLSWLYYLHLHCSTIQKYAKTWCFLQSFVFLGGDVPFSSGLTSHLHLWWVSCSPRTSCGSNSWVLWYCLPGTSLCGVFPQGLLCHSLLSPAPPQPEPWSSKWGSDYNAGEVYSPTCAQPSALQVSANSCFRGENITWEYKITGIL